MVGKKRGKKEIGVHGTGVDPGALKYSTAGGRADGADADGFGPWNGWTGGTGCRVGRGGGGGGVLVSRSQKSEYLVPGICRA